LAATPSQPRHPITTSRDVDRPAAQSEGGHFAADPGTRRTSMLLRSPKCQRAGDPKPAGDRGGCIVTDPILHPRASLRQEPDSSPPAVDFPSSPIAAFHGGWRLARNG
jgi:hypothetical protein